MRFICLLCGAGFELARAHNAVSERCLQKWIKVFNEKGIDGITYKPRSGRPRILPPEDVRKKILSLVDEPKLAGQHHWTAARLAGYFEKEGLELSCSTLVRYLHE
jgi:transposase